MSRVAKYLIGAAWMIVQSVAQRLAGFVSTTVLAQMLGASGLGHVAIVSSTSSTFYGLTKLGADMGTHVLLAGKNPAKDGQILSEVLGQSLLIFFGIGLIGSAFCFLLAEPVAVQLFSDRALADYIRIAAVMFLFQVLMHYAYVGLAGLHAFSAYGTVMTIMAPITAWLAIGGALAAGTMGAIWGIVAGQALLALAVGAALVRTATHLGIRIHPRIASRAHLTSIFAIGLPFYSISLFQLPAEYTIQALLVREHTIAALGDLRVVVAISAIIALLPNSLLGPMISALSRKHGEGGSNALALVLAHIKTLWLLSLGLSIGVGLIWPELIALCFGSEYRAAMQWGFISLVAASAGCLRAVVNADLLASRRMRDLFTTGLFEAVIFVCVGVLLIPSYGLLGFLLAHAVSAVALLVLFAALMLGGNPDSRANAPWLLIGLALSVAAYGTIAAANMAKVDLTLRLGTGFVLSTLTVAAWFRFVFAEMERSAALTILATVRARLPARWRGGVSCV